MQLVRGGGNLLEHAAIARGLKDPEHKHPKMEGSGLNNLVQAWKTTHSIGEPSGVPLKRIVQPVSFVSAA